MPDILHIDTSGALARVAVSKDGNIVSEYISEDTRNHAAQLNQFIENALAASGSTFTNLKAIAVCGGPGSYTGLRIGMATAKGFCYAADIPLMVHNKLTLLSVDTYYNREEEYDCYLAVLPARANEYYISLMGKNMETITEPRHIHENELKGIWQQTGEKVAVTGEVSEDLINGFEVRTVRFIDNNNISFSGWARYANEQYNCNGFVNLHTIEPFYLKQVYTHTPKKSN